MTINCMECGREHVLFYYVNAAGHKVLAIRCDRIEKLFTKKREDGTSEQILKKVNGILTVPPNLVPAKLPADIPERWSLPWTKKMQGKKQLQLVLLK
jgi:hypothetical protein